MNSVSPTQQVVRDAAARRSAEASITGEEKISLQRLGSALITDDGESKNHVSRISLLPNRQRICYMIAQACSV
jgi:hypothetical protein